MASFKDQVEGLASISIGTTPTNSEFSQMLTDGTKDIINRIVAVKPEEEENFTTTTENSDDSGIKIQGKVISVTRKNSNADYLMPCTKIRTSDRYEVTNSDSLKFRSGYNPGFYVLDGRIYGIPISGGISTKSLVVTQLNYPVVEYSNTLIPSFPKKYEHLVTYYASMMCLLAKAGSLHGDTIVTDAIAAVNTNVDSALTEIATLKSEILNSKSELDSSGGLNTTEEALLHAKKLFSDDAGFNALSNVTDDLSNSTSVTGWLEEEDPEMVTSTIQAIGLELKRAELEMKVWAVKNNNVDNYVKIIGGYQNEIETYLKTAQAYAAEASKRMEYLNQEYTWYIHRYREFKNKYNEGFLTESQIQQKKASQKQASARGNRRKRRR